MAWAIFGPFASAMAVAGAISKGGDQVAGWAVAGFLLLLGTGVHWLVSRARLEVSAAGVKLRQIGYTLETAWTNVETLRMDKGQEGFVTREPIKSRGAELLSSMRGVAFGLGRMPIYDGTARQLLRQHRYIPIEAFAWHVRHGELADDLNRLAPHVRTSSAAAPKVKPTPQQKRQDRIALAVIFGFTAVVLITVLLIPAAAYPHVIPGLWALFTTFFAAQAVWFARIAIRSGTKWLALLYVFAAIAIGLWSAVLWGEAISGKAPPKHVQRSGI